MKFLIMSQVVPLQRILLTPEFMYYNYTGYLLIDVVTDRAVTHHSLTCKRCLVGSDASHGRLKMYN